MSSSWWCGCEWNRTISTPRKERDRPCRRHPNVRRLSSEYHTASVPTAGISPMSSEVPARRRQQSVATPMSLPALIHLRCETASQMACRSKGVQIAGSGALGPGALGVVLCGSGSTRKPLNRRWRQASRHSTELSSVCCIDSVVSAAVLRRPIWAFRVRVVQRGPATATK
jgi:hypothetical protein